MDSFADISVCDRYRYSLLRSWDLELPDLGWLMLNPSTADATDDDPTIRRCMGFARRWGYGGIYVCNLFAWRATEPKDLRKLLDPSGPKNNEAIQKQAMYCPEIIVGWGKPRWPFVQRRAWAVIDMLLASPAMIKSLGINSDGSPRHPLYLANDTERVPFNSAALANRAAQGV